MTDEEAEQGLQFLGMLLGDYGWSSLIERARFSVAHRDFAGPKAELRALIDEIEAQAVHIPALLGSAFEILGAQRMTFSVDQSHPVSRSPHPPIDPTAEEPDLVLTREMVAPLLDNAGRAEEVIAELRKRFDD